MSRKSLLISFVFFILLFTSVFPEKLLKLSGVRPPFFILKIPAAEGEVDHSRVIYSKYGKKVAEYTMLGITGTEALCKCKKISADINSDCYVKIRVPIPQKAIRQNRSFISEAIKIRGVKFIKSENGGFITENPVPLSMIPELSFRGIEDFLNKIGKEYERNCRAELLSPDEIRKNIITGDERTLLSERDGLPILIFCSNSGFRENPVSVKILKKLKYEVFIPLKLNIL